MVQSSLLLGLEVASRGQCRQGQLTPPSHQAKGCGLEYTGCSWVYGSAALPLGSLHTRSYGPLWPLSWAWLLSQRVEGLSGKLADGESQAHRRIPCEHPTELSKVPAQQVP